MGNKLYVGGLPFSVTDGTLEELFKEHGTVESARVISDKFTGKSRGFGFVEMSNDEQAQKAIEALNETQLEGRTLTVNEAKPQDKGPVVVSETTEGEAGGGAVANVPAGSFSFKLKPKNIRRTVWSQPRPFSPVS